MTTWLVGIALAAAAAWLHRGSSQTSNVDNSSTPAGPLNIPPLDNNTPETPAPAATISQLIYSAATKWNVDPDLISAYVAKESNFNPRAINPGDPSYGLGQIQKFWFDYFGLPSDQASMLDPENNLDCMAQVLTYFRSRTNPRTGVPFAFPDDADIYNVGETLWAKGTRNLPYRDDVRNKFFNLKGTR